MEAAIRSTPTSKLGLWAGRIISLLVVLFLLFDSITKILKVPAVLQAAAQLKFSVPQIVGIGIVLLLCTVIYVIPRTSIFGAILLTGYLGGATAIQLHAGSTLFETLFPVIFGVLVWGGLFLRDPEVRAIMPLRARSASRPNE